MKTRNTCSWCGKGARYIVRVTEDASGRPACAKDLARGVRHADSIRIEYGDDRESRGLDRGVGRSVLVEAVAS